MTDKKSRRVVIINNIKSDTIDQAIFILKSSDKQKHSKYLDNSIAAEAQAIIDNYIRQVDRLKCQKIKDNKKTSFKMLIVAFGFLLVGFLLSFLRFM